MNEEKENKTRATATSIAYDGKPIEVTDTPYGLSEKADIKNSIKQPVMARDISRASTELKDTTKGIYAFGMSGTSGVTVDLFGGQGGSLVSGTRYCVNLEVV